MDEIDRILLADDEVPVPARFVANVMADVRAAAHPAPRAFPWHILLPRFAAGAALAVATAVVITQVDPAPFVRAARELAAAGAVIAGALAAIYLPRLTDAWD